MRVVLFFVPLASYLYLDFDDKVLLSENLPDPKPAAGWVDIPVNSDQDALWILFKQEPTADEYEALKSRFVRENAEIFLAFHRSDVEDHQVASVKARVEELCSPKNICADTFNRKFFDDIWSTFSRLLVDTHKKKPVTETFTNLAEAIKTKKNTPLRRFHRLTHRLSHIFTPIFIDLEGLKETDFEEEYWQEIVGEYAAFSPLKEARKVIYGSKPSKDDSDKAESEEDSIKSIIEQNNDAKTAMEKIKNLLPEDEILPAEKYELLPASEKIHTQYVKARTVLNALADKGGKAIIRKSLNRKDDKIQNSAPPKEDIFTWHRKLEEALNELQQAVEPKDAA